MAESMNTRPLGDMPDAWLALWKAQLQWSQDLWQAFTGQAAPSLPDAWRDLQSRLPQTVCHVPPPCWLPVKLGDCISHAGACAVAKLRIVVTNCDVIARTISIRVDGDKEVEMTPASAHVGPMQRATFELRRKIGEDAEAGLHEALVWIDGCRRYVLRWTVSVGTSGFDSCHEIAVDDCQEHRHHWYDHFYCHRPCTSRAERINA